MTLAHSSETSKYTQHTKQCNITEDYLSDTHKETLKIYKNRGFKKVPEHHSMKACRVIRGKYVHIIDFGRNYEKKH